MQVLLRNYGDEEYVWRTAKYGKDGFVVNKTPVSKTNVVSVMNDNRHNYVRCSHCGKVVHKNKIEEHRNVHKDYTNCYNCGHRNTGYPTNTTLAYKKSKNGKYVEITKKELDLYCDVGWSNAKIESDEARNKCVYRLCESAKMEEITDIFTEHKGVFDYIATVNSLLKIGYKPEDSYNMSQWKLYKLDTDLHIYAAVNSLGIIDHFLVHHDWSEYKVLYSKKYDRLYSTTSRDYVDAATYLAPDILEKAKTEIKKLYN